MTRRGLFARLAGVIAAAFVPRARVFIDEIHVHRDSALWQALTPGVWAIDEDIASSMRKWINRGQVVECAGAYVGVDLAEGESISDSMLIH